MSADLINAGFQLLGAFLISLHCAALWRERAVAGVSIPAVFAFALWAVWNLYYFTVVEHWWSFAGALVCAAAHVAYISLILRFKRKEPSQ
jgi:hypothetical protein